MKLLPCSLLFLTLALGPAALAQDKKPDAPPAPGKRDADTLMLDIRMRRLATELVLTEAQRDKLRPIIAEEMAQYKAFHTDEKLTREDLLKKEQELRDAAKPKVQAILSAEQFAKYEAMPKRKARKTDEPKPAKENPKPAQDPKAR